ncbi:MBL fold metallo-hydrolase [Massilia endophytica]|uniref:MBL fold metallo-hydrolase n=1 Tax=Massilia endophytica TaxID=2899220 RepID=UPI001E4C9F20|nr:MBL fold metallo-hydrolase [Massilia endophytica]UGQ44546.1 MBL fold metallo-hydrolase [Massilia endophytica]
MRILLPLCLILAHSLACAVAPAQGVPPALFRFMLGATEVTVLNDGSMPLTPEDMRNVTPAAMQEALARQFLSSPVETSHNAFLINTGARLVLIDAGGGDLVPTLGRLAGNLRAAGYTPEQVDAIYITHMHGDHIGGLTEQERRLYPNATVFINKREADHWLDPTEETRAVPARRELYRVARTRLAPYQAAKRMQTFDGETELEPGLRAISGRGHTPGHTAYVLSAGGQQLILIGDQVHMGAVQFPHPQATVRYDYVPDASTAERRRSLDAAADRCALVAGAHLPFPGVGHVRREGSGYAFVPLNFSPTGKPVACPSGAATSN